MCVVFHTLTVFDSPYKILFGLGRVPGQTLTDPF